MSLQAVVKKDLRDGMRSKLVWAIVAIYALFLAAISFTVSGGGNPQLALAALGGGIVLLVLVIVPLTGLVVSIKSITRERDVGTIKILLSLPHSRAEVVAGKFLGRSAILAAAIVTGLLPAAIVISTQLSGFPFTEFAALAVVSILLGLQFVSIGIAVSALLERESQATLAGIGLFFVLLLWERIFDQINEVADFISGDLALFIYRFHLYYLFLDMVRAISALREDLPSNASAVVGPQDAETALRNGVPVVVENQPFYLAHWFAFVVLAAWIAVPLAIGYYRFERMDL